MKRSILTGLCILVLALFSNVTLSAQSQAFEVRNCTSDLDLCAGPFPIIPTPSGCGYPNLFTCGGTPNLPAGDVVNLTVDLACYYLLVYDDDNSFYVSSNDPSGSYDGYCVCWDRSGATHIMTIYEGDCMPPCPAPDCP